MQGFALEQTNQHQWCDRRIEEAVDGDDGGRCDGEKDGDAERQASEPHGRPMPCATGPRAVLGCPADGGPCLSPAIHDRNFRAMLFNDLENVLNVVRLYPGSGSCGVRLRRPSNSGEGWT